MMVMKMEITNDKIGLSINIRTIPWVYLVESVLIISAIATKRGCILTPALTF
jgi:hypothetical protein